MGCGGGVGLGEIVDLYEPFNRNKGLVCEADTI